MLVRSDQCERSAQVRSCYSGQMRSGQVSLGQVNQLRSGQIRSERFRRWVRSAQVCQLGSSLSDEVQLVSSSSVRLVSSSQFVSFRSSQARIGQVNLGQVGQVFSGEPLWVKPTKWWQLAIMSYQLKKLIKITIVPFSARIGSPPQFQSYWLVHCKIQQKYNIIAVVIW